MTPEELHRLVDGIYGASYNDALWRDVMPTVKSHLDASQVVVGFFDAGTGQQDTIYGDCSPYYSRLFLELGHANPFVGALAAAPVGATIIDQALMPTEAFERTDFFNVWLARRKSIRPSA